jgi:hypothetical protein
VGHILFFCLGSWAVWFAASMAIRIEELPILFKDVPTYIRGKLSRDQMALATNIMWCICKAHNAMVISAKDFKPISIVHQAQAMLTPQSIHNEVVRTPQTIQYQISRDTEVLLVDASWDQSSKTGLAYLTYNATGVLTWSARYTTSAPDAFTAEAMATKSALRQWTERAILGTKVVIYTDIRALVQALDGGMAGQCSSWRAVKLVERLRRTMEGEGERIRIHHVCREAL